MLDEDKLIRLKKIGSLALIGLLAIFSYGLGAASQARQVQAVNQKIETKVTKKSEALTQEKVKEFLLAYYTKKDLGENRKRYKPFMTSALYQEQTSFEEESVNLAYKGYIVDYQFKDAKIYIDNANQTVLATVRYTNTLLSVKDKRDSRQAGVSNEVTLKLTYQLINNHFLVDKMETMTLTTAGSTGTPNEGTLSQSLTSEENSSDSGVSNEGETQPQPSDTTNTETESTGGN